MKIIKYVKPKEDYSELIKRCGYEPNTPNTFKTLQEVIEYLHRTGYKNPVSWGEIQKLIH